MAAPEDQKTIDHRPPASIPVTAHDADDDLNETDTIQRERCRFPCEIGEKQKIRCKINQVKKISEPPREESTDGWMDNWKKEWTNPLVVSYVQPQDFCCFRKERYASCFLVRQPRAIRPGFNKKRKRIRVSAKKVISKALFHRFHENPRVFLTKKNGYSGQERDEED